MGVGEGRAVCAVGPMGARGRWANGAVGRAYALCWRRQVAAPLGLGSSWSESASWRSENAQVSRAGSRSLLSTGLVPKPPLAAAPTEGHGPGRHTCAHPAAGTAGGRGEVQSAPAGTAGARSESHGRGHSHGSGEPRLRAVALRCLRTVLAGGALPCAPGDARGRGGGKR